MTISDYQFASQLGLVVPFRGSGARPRFLTPFGRPTVLATAAVVVGAILGLRL
jgi:hypothetical protein